MKKLSFILLGITLALIQGIAQNAKQHLKAGEQFLSNGMIDAALEEFKSAIKIDPTSGEAYEKIAEIQLSGNDSISAAENFRKAAGLNQNPVVNYYIAAEIFYSLDKAPRSKDCIEKGLGIKAKNFDLLILKTKILFEEKNYIKSFEIAQEAIKAKDMAVAYYYSGACAYRTGDVEQAIKDLEKAIIRDRNIGEAYLELASIQIDQKKYEYAIDNCSMVLLLIDPENVRALVLRSKAFHNLKESDQTLTDITKAISIDKNNWKLYYARAMYNFDYALYANAVDDYTLAIQYNDTLNQAYKYRGISFEKLDKKIKALNDYKLYKTVIENRDGTQSEIQFIKNKIFEIGKESNRPIVQLNKNLLNEKSEIKIKEQDKTIFLEGTVEDESDLSSFKINNKEIQPELSGNGKYKFSIELATHELDYVTITASDTYNNMTTRSFPITHIETVAPEIRLISPVAENNNIIHLESDDNTLYIEGRIEDNSNIREIKIDEINASFAPGDYNPRFTATIDLKNRKNVTITAVDAFGNRAKRTYEFSKEGYLLAENNPMGKTWVVIIENSDYEQYTNLTQTNKDVYNLKDALSRYKISKILHKKNMTKREMERFFALDLRDLIISNNVNSLMIWYAGHGQNINNMGFWIPNDGRLNDEYSYYNINALKASLYSYTSLTHVLVVSDACKAGESFTIALRGDNSLATCNDIDLIRKKSALVLTSSTHEAALDNSLFAQTFTNALANNPADCIPIDAIAERISIVMHKHTNQVPQFGRISGLEDKSGTFFFISK